MKPKHFFTFLAFVFFWLPLYSYAFSGSGAGTSGDPFQITTCAQLQEMSDDLDAHYILGGNIDCSDTENWNSGSGFLPVGTGFETSTAFSGSLNGNEKKISNLFINRPDTSQVGLFGSVYGGHVYDVGLEDVDITGADRTGGLVGFLYFNSGTIRGTVERSYTTGNVSGTTRVGGIAGEQGVSDIANSYSRANVEGRAGSWIGGVAGVTSDSDSTNSRLATKGISNSYATGNVTAGISNIRGGFSGGDGARISNSFAVGNVTTGGSNGGGFHGRSSNSIVSGNHWYNHGGNPNTCLGSLASGSFPCTTITDINHFKDSSNAPLSSWDFDEVWAVEEGSNDGFPYLQWQSFDTAPSVVSFSPADDATNVAVSSDLEITFDEVVNVGSGNVTIKKATDDSTVEAIDVTGGQVTGGGSNTITINPSSDLAEATQYYVEIDSTAFDDTTVNDYPGISATTTWNFTTGDDTAPSLSNITVSTASSSATISWNTNENASTQIEYGLTSSYGVTTTETNTSPRTTSHSQTISDLVNCTQYHYRVLSTDAANNTANSSDGTFATTGCNGNTSVATSNSVGNVATTTGGSLTQGNVALTIPSGYYATSTLTFQTNVLDGTTFFNNVSNPTGLLQAGSNVYNLKAFLDATTTVTSFDNAVTVTLTYTDGDVSNLDESSLAIYRWNGSAWNELSNCVVDTGANTVSCTTTQFSEFSIFGDEAPVGSRTSGSVSGGVLFGCKDEDATNYNRFSAHKQELCEYETGSVPTNNLTSVIANLKAKLADLVAQFIALTGTQPETTVSLGTVRDLEIGIEGEDVRKLQTLLIGQGYTISAGATGYFGLQTQSALDSYQVDNNIAPRGGYFGPLTREQMVNAKLDGLWW